MISKINAFLNRIAYLIMFFLPDSPFRDTINAIEKADWLHYLNWFIPVGTFTAIGTAWVSAIAIFYAYQIILRWAKAVAD